MFVNETGLLNQKKKTKQKVEVAQQSFYAASLWCWASIGWSDAVTLPHYVRSQKHLVTFSVRNIVFGWKHHLL